ncbi:MAG: 16S rRNA (cytosine(967)-C(5))-methyltransferase RsmB [bacterium]
MRPRTSRADPREAILGILRRVDGGGAFSNVLLHQTLTRQPFSPADQAFITEITLGTLRQRGRLDYALTAVLDRPLDGLPGPIRAILRMGLYQLLFLDRVPDAAAVDEAVGAARRHGHRGTAGLVNAVLRRLAAEGEPAPPAVDADPAGHLAVTLSHPRWLVQRWLERWGPEDTRALCAANNAPPPSMLRVNPLRTTRERVLAALRERGMKADAGRWPESIRVRGSLGERLDLYRDGLVTMQDEGAMAVGRAADPRAGETILDAAAGTGGKATHLAEVMGNRGRVIALDLAPAKLRALSANAARLSIDIIEAHHLDAREAGARFPGAADRVVLDAPCSGLGVVRRRPEIRWRIVPASLAPLATLQAQLLAGVAEAVRPGGTLLYAVCSTEPEEGEAVVRRFREQRAGTFALEQEQTLLPHRDGTDGFYIARLTRAMTSRPATRDERRRGEASARTPAAGAAGGVVGA